MIYTTKWENYNPAPDFFYIEECRIDNYDKTDPIICIYKPNRSTKYFVDYDCDVIFSSTDLYAAIDYANKFLITQEYIELPEKLAVLL